MIVTISIDGVGAASAYIAHLPKKSVGAMSRRLTQEMRRVLRISQTQYCPVDSGNLKRSGYVEKEDTLDVTVGYNIYYAIYVHEGHATRSGGHVAGRKFLQIPFEQEAQGILDGLADAVRSSL